MNTAADYENPQVSFTDSYQDITFPSPGVGYLLRLSTFPGVNTRVFKTTNGGKTWALLPASVNYSSFALQQLHFLTDSVGLMSGNEQGLLRTAERWAELAAD